MTEDQNTLKPNSHHLNPEVHAGWIAFMAGTPRTENPHEPDTLEHDQWFRHWNAAYYHDRNTNRHRNTGCCGG